MRTRTTLSTLLGLALALLAPALRAQDEAPKDDPDAKPAAPKLARPKPIPEKALGNTLPTTVVRRGAAGFNVQMADASVLPREKSPELDYDTQTAEFTRNEALTGSTSGAKAVIVDQIDYGKNGTLTLGKVSGTFQDGETVTDSKGGSATAKGGVREGIWILDFAFKPVRVKDVEIKGMGRQQVYYLYYRVINHTGKPRMFVPEFNLVTDAGKLHRDVPLPEIVPVIKAREDPTTTLLGGVDIVGMIPPSTKDGLDDAVFGVAFWIVKPRGELAKADAFKVYVRGLSDSMQDITPPDGAKPVTKYKTLRIDFSRFGDDRDINEKEIRLLDPPYEWIYW